MKKFKFFVGALALAVVAATIFACNKDKETQLGTTDLQQQAMNSNDYTLAEMIDAMSWEDGKGFFENQPIKDYTDLCEMVMKGCESEEKKPWLEFIFEWHWAPRTDDCISSYPGICLIIRHIHSLETNAMGRIEDGKLIIVPTGDENGFTADGYFAVGSPIQIQNDSIIVREGIYTAYYDEELGKYTSVAVDVDSSR